MNTTRLEAFSDGVIAILITIMVLDLRTPADANWHAVQQLGPEFCAYVLSFVFLGIYWSNHHHMFQMTERVTGGILWANLHLLFWLSLIPFATAWTGETRLAPLPTAMYGVDLLLAGGAYTILARVIIRSQGAQSALRDAIGADLKGNASVALYALAIPIAFWRPWLAGSIYAIVALMWLVPDRRIERHVAQRM
ncbi:MAG TPA: TMEM175 family protein [Vicinamibacterales bacterium]